MRTVQWNRDCYVIDGKPAFLVSGEFHYFRVPREDWRVRLELFKQAGGNCVATYIPWILHEPEEGDIRFGDTPQRDLEGFLNLCAEVGLLVICRPGPYQYSELKYEGLPGWLCENYPEILAKDVHGNTIRLASVSYLHPVFLEKARVWFDAVCPIIARYTAARGGPVAFAQMDNELMGMHMWYGGADYHPETAGFGREDGRYARFLRAKYGDIAALNRSYGRAFPSFAGVRPVDPGAAQTVGDRRSVKDYQDFYFAMTAEYAAILAGWMRRHGIDCGLVHNSGNPGMNSYFTETVERLRGELLLGSDHYYNLSMDWPQNNPTPQYALKALWSCETLASMGFPASVFEIPSGSCADWPPATPVDLKCCYYLNTALGMKGLNYYVFTGGPNPKGTGAFGEDYDYGAPIGSSGQVRPSYDVLHEFGNFLADNAWLCEARRAVDVGIGFVHEYNRGETYAGGAGFDADDAGTFLLKGLMATALCASASPGLVDLESGDLKPDKPLLVPASHCLSARAQQGLVDFIKSGGHVLIAPVLPTMDEDWNPCTILADFLSCGAIERLNLPAPTVAVGPVYNVLANGSLWACDAAPEGARVIATEAGTGRCVGWRRDFPGGGAALWLGLSWMQARREHERMMKYLLSELGICKPAVRCDNPNLWTALWSDGRRSMLFVMNLFTSAMRADIETTTASGESVRFADLEVGPMQVLILDIN